MTNDEIKAWEDELTAMFAVGGIVGGDLFPGILEGERIVGADFAREYAGHTKAMDSLFDFLAVTLTLLTRFMHEHGWPAHKHYAVMYLMYLTLFRTFRAADVLAKNGYFNHGYSILRSVKDQAFAIAAVANKLTSATEIFGWTEGDGTITAGNVDMERIVKTRMKAEKEAEDFLYGQKSELSEDHQGELLMWSRMFNWQAHRGMMTYSDEMGRMLEGKGDFDLRPVRGESGEALFMNRCHEMGWMIIQLIPFLQVEGRVFSDDWRKKWDMLDRTFTIFNTEFTKLGKPLGKAFAAMIEAKFHFSPETRYSE